MTAAVVLIVAAGVVLTAAAGIAAGLDAAGVVILGLIVALGAMAIAVALKSRGGSVAPGRCPECRGLISPNAPYCKHCGAPSGGD